MIKPTSSGFEDLAASIAASACHFAQATYKLKLYF